MNRATSYRLFLLALCACPAAPKAPVSSAPELPEIWDRPPSADPVWVENHRPLKAPTRIVALAPGLTETLFALGLGARVVGTSRFADHPPEALDRPKVGGLTDLDVEAVLALRPNLVVAIPGEAYRHQLRILARAKVPVLVLPGSSIADYRRTAITLAEVMGVPERGLELSRGLKAELLALTASTPRSAPSVAVVYGWQPLFLAGPDSFPDELLTLLGARNVVLKGPPWARWSAEALLAAAPEVLIDATGAPTPPKNLSSLPAVRAGRVHPAHPAMMRPGPRLHLAARGLLGQLRSTP